MPLYAAGNRTEPPMSVPSASGPYPATIPAPAPELEPAEFRATFQGLRVIPCRLETPDASMPKSGIVVLPSSTQPASRTRAVGGASVSLGVMSPAAVPTGAGKPLTAILSLIVIGTPSIGLSGLRRRHRRSDAAAAASAPSASVMYMALI